MKNKRLYLVIGIIFLVAIFINLNVIISFFLDDNLMIHRVNFADYENAGQAYVYMNELQYNENNIQEILTCDGWAFAETSLSNENKEIRLLLKGEKNTYITEKCGLRISSIQWSMEDWKSVPDGNNNFAIRISTITLPDDIYKIYAYIVENEQDRGIVDTGKSFRKEGIKLYEYTAGDICEDILPEIATNQFDNGWLTIENLNGCVRVEGWETVNNVESEKTKYYISYVGDNSDVVTIEVPNVYLDYIADHLGDNIYTGSGLYGALAFEDLPDTCGYLYVLGSYGELWFSSEGHRYDITD